MILRSGIDLVEIDRFANLQPHLRERFIERVFTPAEIELCNDRNTSLAGRFAAKEAVAKALGTGIGEVRWQDIEILADEKKSPVLHLHEKAAEIAAALGLTQWSISITHTNTMAAGQAIGVGE
jgi:holo-[acyl-carrier protein] synthase